MINMLRLLFLIVAICVTVPSVSQAQSNEKLGYIEVLRGAQASKILDQCSRSVPKKGNSTWVPNIDQIKTMEAALLPILRSRQPDVNWTDFSDDWGRRYVGIVREGRHYIYGDYSPHGLGPVCDGGPAFFGAEWDVEANKFTHLAFNGAI